MNTRSFCAVPLITAVITILVAGCSISGSTTTATFCHGASDRKYGAHGEFGANRVAS